MKTAYFDCFSGISGNMVLGALIDLGLEPDLLHASLASMVEEEFRLEAKRVKKGPIEACHLEVKSDEERIRQLPEILEALDGSALKPEVKETCRRTFIRMVEAEARIHGGTVQDVHLHEIGELDTLVDVAGSLAGLDMLGIEKVVSSPVNLGKGMIKCKHGTVPVPAPITAELMKGASAYSGEVEGELTTPTGAAIITALAERFGSMPLMKLTGTGYGAGTMDLAVPNVLRVLVGEVPEADLVGMQEVALLETNIDDMNPQLYEPLMEDLFQWGALDAFLTPLQMKKGRPGTMLSVLCEVDRINRLLDIIVRESTTLGVRVSRMQRLALPRTYRTVQTEYGEIRVKLAVKDGRTVRAVPEYEDCKRAARGKGVPVGRVYLEAQAEARSLLDADA